MDFLRSCYSASMALDQAGNVYPVDWYFVPSSTPLFGPEHPVSLNWARPEYGDQTIGEVPGAARPYSKGARPAYVPSSGTWPQTGLDTWYALGAPGPAAGPPPITWDGRRTFAGGPAAGIFPPTPPSMTPARQLQTNQTYTFFDQGSTTTQSSWLSLGRTPALAVYWERPAAGTFFPCYAGTFTLFWSTGVPGGFLRCTSYDALSGLSTWDDPSGQGLFAGELLTLHGV